MLESGITQAVSGTNGRWDNSSGIRDERLKVPGEAVVAVVSLDMLAHSAAYMIGITRALVVVPSPTSDNSESEALVRGMAGLRAGLEVGHKHKTPEEMRAEFDQARAKDAQKRVEAKLNFRGQYGQGPLSSTPTRRLHSSTFQHNVSAFCGTGGALRCFEGVCTGCWAVIRGWFGCILCQKRLRLSCKVDECEPLTPT